MSLASGLGRSLMKSRRKGFVRPVEISNPDFSRVRDVDARRKNEELSSLTDFSISETVLMYDVA